MLVDRGLRGLMWKLATGGGEEYIEALLAAAEVIRESNDGVINQQ